MELVLAKNKEVEVRNKDVYNDYYQDLRGLPAKMYGNAGVRATVLTTSLYEDYVTCAVV